MHTNNVESFWAILKRGVYGIYHHVSVKYLQAYVNEFCFRFNNKDNGDMFDLMLSQAVIAWRTHSIMATTYKELLERKKIDYPVKARGTDVTFKKAEGYEQKSQQKEMQLWGNIRFLFR